MKIKYSYLTEFLKPVSLNTFVKYLDMEIADDKSDEITLHLNEKDKAIKISSNIFSIFPAFTEFLKKFNFEIIQKTSSYVIIRAKDFTKLCGIGVKFASESDWKEINRFFHISSVSPNIILHKGLRCKASLDQYNRFEGHSSRIYLFSVERLYDKIASTSYDKPSDEKDWVKLIRNESLKKLDELKNMFITKYGNEKYYIYEVKIPMNFPIYVDKSYEYGVYVRNNITPENINLIN